VFTSNSGAFLSISFDGGTGFTITVDPAVKAIAPADVFQVTSEGTALREGVVQRDAVPPDQVINVRIFDDLGAVRAHDFILHWYTVAQG